jgi:putative FmdB family regulatory protein
VPRYDYRCRTCDRRFEVRRGFDDPETGVRCPDGHEHTSRVFTAVSVASGSGGSPAPGAGPAPAGGCCGGGCCG